MRTHLSIFALALLLASCRFIPTAPVAHSLPPDAWPAYLLPRDTLSLAIRVVDPDPTLLGLRVRWGEQITTLNGSGPFALSLPRLAHSPADLRIETLPAEANYTSVFLPLFTDRCSWDLSLLPLSRSELNLYERDLDLLAEFVRPFDGGTIRRWPVETLRVSEPAPQPDVDYLGTLRNAVTIWNQLLEVQRFVLVPRGSPAEVECEVFEESSLGYTRLVSRDGDRRPLHMLVHLSPRFAAGAERYVQRAWLHELGHVQGLWGHSQDPSHILYARFIAVDEPAAQELKMARWLWSIPQGTHLGWYVLSDSNQAEGRVMSSNTEAFLIQRSDPRGPGTVACHPWPPSSPAPPAADR
jgi:hypothetical protein